MELCYWSVVAAVLLLHNPTLKMRQSSEQAFDTNGVQKFVSTLGAINPTATVAHCFHVSYKCFTQIYEHKRPEAVASVLLPHVRGDIVELQTSRGCLVKSQTAATVWHGGFPKAQL